MKNSTKIMRYQNTSVNLLETKSLGQKLLFCFEAQQTHFCDINNRNGILFYLYIFSMTSTLTSSGNYAQRVKIGIIGPERAGKTHLLHHYLFRTHQHILIQPTIAVQFYERVINVRDTSVALRIWDSSGQNRYKPIVPYHLKECELILLVYDLGKEETLDHLENWLKLLEKEQFDLGTKKIKIVGNKADLSSTESMTKKVPKRELKALLSKYSLGSSQIHEVSSVSMDPQELNYIKQIFQGGIGEILEERQNDEILTMRRKLGSDGISVTQEGEEKKEGYCGNHCGPGAGQCTIY